MKPLSINCACCHANQDDPKAVRIGNSFVCRDCARSGILLSKEEAKDLLSTLQSDIELMDDVLRDPGFSKREHEDHRQYVLLLGRLCRRIKVRLGKKASKK